eukprot:scaffold959_cov258-Pinguiococcus_pyrenoidosus.AAC.5
MWPLLFVLVATARGASEADAICGGFRIHVVQLPKPSFSVIPNATSVDWDIWDPHYQGPGTVEVFRMPPRPPIRFRTRHQPPDLSVPADGPVPGLAGVPCSYIRAGDVWHLPCMYLTNLGMGSVQQQTLTPLDFYDTYSFSLDWFVLRYIYNNCHEEDPEKATLFFLPLPLTMLYKGFAFHMFTAEEVLGYLSQVKAHLEALETWKRKGGRDHLIVVSKTIYDFQDVRKGAAYTGFRNSDPFWSLTNVFSIEGPFHQRLINMPYPTFLHPRSDSDVDNWLAQIQAAKRSRKAILAAGSRASRRHLIKECSADNGACDYFSASGDVADTAFTYWNLIDLYMKYTFTLQPAGDTPTRRGFFDSLLAGSIPIIFDSIDEPRRKNKLSGRLGDRRYIYSYARFFGETSDENRRWIEKIAIVVEYEEDAFRAIKEITDEQIAQLQKNIVEIIPSLLYWDTRWRSDSRARSRKYGAQNPIARALRELRDRPYNGTPTGTALDQL